LEGLRGEVQGGPFFPQDERLAVAFKSTTVTPRTIVELAKRLQFMKKIEVVRGSELKAGYSTPGIVRENAFESIHRYISLAD